MAVPGPALRVAHVGRLRTDTSNGVDKTVAGLALHSPPDVEVELWHLTPDVTRVRERLVEGVRVLSVPWPRDPLRQVLSPPRRARAFLRERASAVDVVHLHSVYVPGNFWASRAAAAVVLTPHGGTHPHVEAGPHAARKRVARITWEGRTRERARVWHAVSHGEAALLAAQGRRDVVVVPNGIPDADLREPAPLPAPDGPIVYLGRLAVHHKGLDLLVAGYAEAVSRGRVPDLVLAGPGEATDVARVRSLVERAGLSGRVALPGAVHGGAKDDLIRDARVFVHTSRRDGLPFAVIEAMAAARPVLVTPGTNLDELVERSGAGLVVQAAPDAIAAGVETVSAWSATELMERGTRARQLVERELRWSVLARSMVEVYRRAAG